MPENQNNLKEYRQINFLYNLFIFHTTDSLISSWATVNINIKYKTQNCLQQSIAIAAHEINPTVRKHLKNDFYK